MRRALTLPFFRRLVTPPDEQAFVDGLQALVAGDRLTSMAHLRGATHLADGALAAGCLALDAGAFEEAATDLEAAVAASAQLGRTFARYGIALTLALHVTDEISAALAPNPASALLALVEAYQRLGRLDDALAGLRRLQALAPADPVVRLSLAELLVHRVPLDRASLQEAARLGEGVPMTRRSTRRSGFTGPPRSRSSAFRTPRWRCSARPSGGPPTGRSSSSRLSATSGPSPTTQPVSRSAPGSTSSASTPTHPATPTWRPGSGCRRERSRAGGSD